MNSIQSLQPIKFGSYPIGPVNKAKGVLFYALNVEKKLPLKEIQVNKKDGVPHDLVLVMNLAKANNAKLMQALSGLKSVTGLSADKDSFLMDNVPVKIQYKSN